MAKKVRKVRPPRPLNQGEVMTDFIYDLYSRTLDVFEKAIGAGAANVPLSMSALDGFFDLLYGGAKMPSPKFGGYAAVPSEMAQVVLGNEANSPYYIGVTNAQLLANTTGGISLLPGILPGSPPDGAPDLVRTYADANVPTIFPRLLSTEFMGRWMIFRAQAFTTTLFINVGTGIKTWVEAGKEVVQTARGGRGRPPKKKRAEATEEALASAIPESGETVG